MKSIIVYSGKGGVGKTTTSANIAKTLAEQGHKVFVVDADINTPSMGVIFGNEHPNENIWVASTSFFYKSMIYMESAMIRKYLRDTVKKINEIEPDFVIIDTPPSITDVHINLLEVMQISAIVIVTQPNDLSRTDVNRTAIFFTDKCKDAGCFVVENMCTKETEYTYSWKCVEKIPLLESFNGADVFNTFKHKYENIVRELKEMNVSDVRMESQKRMLFDESITVNDLPYFDKSTISGTRFSPGYKPEDIKFINIATWDEIKDRLLEIQEFVGLDDEFLYWNTTERISRLLKSFEYDDEAYFLITKAPQTEIPLLPGEIGKGSLFIDKSYYGVPRIKYKTRNGEVVLFPHEVMPADENEIRIALEDGSEISSDGRYIPSEKVLEEVYHTFGSRTGIGKNWREMRTEILDQNKKQKTQANPVHTKLLDKAKDKKKRHQTQ